MNATNSALAPAHHALLSTNPTLLDAPESVGIPVNHCKKKRCFVDQVGDNVAGMKQGYEQQRINHSAKIYVMGDIHTNTIEGFWSLLKRGIGGVYHAVSEKYLQTYCGEYAFRYNRRAADEPMFTSLLCQIVAKAE